MSSSTGAGSSHKSPHARHRLMFHEPSVEKRRSCRSSYNIAPAWPHNGHDGRGRTLSSCLAEACPGPICDTLRVTAASWLATKGRALLRYGPGFAIEVLIFWVMLELFQQLNYGGRTITDPQSSK